MSSTLATRVRAMDYDRWSEMLPEVLESISDRLPLQEFVTFRGVCRRWRSAPSGRSGITNFSKDAPCLMFYGGFRCRRKASDDDDGAADCYLYNCRLPNPTWCIFRLPHLRGATVMQSNSGWLFARRGRDGHDGHFFLHNPFTLAKIDLPDHRVYEDQVCAMSSIVTTTSTPSSAAATAATCCFIVSRKNETTMEVSLCHIGDSEWESHAVEVRKDKFGTMSAVYLMAEDTRRRLVVIANDNKILAYDYTTKMYGFGRNVPAENASAAIKNIMFQLVEDTCHHKDWLQMFGEGEGGITVSICPLSNRPPNYVGPPYFVGVCPGTIVIAANDGSGGGNGESSSDAPQRKRLKASWIEPKFI